MLKDLPDLVLWESIKRGDQKAFNAIFDRYWTTIFQTAYRYTHDKEACYGITHDIFVALWQKREELQIQSFEAYLTCAARYHVYRHLKTVQASPVAHLDSHEMAAAGVEVNEGHQRIHQAELEHEVSRHVNVLPGRCREIFILSRFQHITNIEIAQRLGISKRTVENQLSYALKHLRVALKAVFSFFF